MLVASVLYKRLRTPSSTSLGSVALHCRRLLTASTVRRTCVASLDRPCHGHNLPRAWPVHLLRQAGAAPSLIESVWTRPFNPQRVNASDSDQAEAAFAAFLETHPPPQQAARAVEQLAPRGAVVREERFLWRNAAQQLRTELGRGHVVWDNERSAFVCTRNPGKSIALLQMPRILQSPFSSSTPEEYLRLISNEKGKTTLRNTLMVLLSADSAVVGIWEGDVLRKHKVLTGYTTRKARGGSQAKYLRQGGPGHSFGGNLRKRETRRLFEEAAARLKLWETDIAGCSQAFMSGDVRVWNMLYSDSQHPPIARDDPRWRRAGLSIRRPRLRDLRRLFKSLSYGTLQTLADQGKEDLT